MVLAEVIDLGKTPLRCHACEPDDGVLSWEIGIQISGDSGSRCRQRICAGAAIDLAGRDGTQGQRGRVVPCSQQERDCRELQAGDGDRIIAV